METRLLYLLFDRCLARTYFQKAYFRQKHERNKKSACCLSSSPSSSSPPSSKERENTLPARRLNTHTPVPNQQTNWSPSDHTSKQQRGKKKTVQILAVMREKKGKSRLSSTTRQTKKERKERKKVHKMKEEPVLSQQRS
jgi:hypothetical protein